MARKPNWTWYLAKPVFNKSTGAFESFNRLGVLDTASNRSIVLGLNAPESAAFTINTHDLLAPAIIPVETCIVCYRNGELKWSGPVWTINETVADQQESVNVTCVGWFQLLLERLLRTGAVGHGIEEGSPTHGVGPTETTSALEQAYSSMEPQAIAQDLLERANYEYPTGITVGIIEPNPAKVKWNVKYQQFQNIGQAIQQLSNTEGGFDFRVDPATLKLNIYYKPVKAGTTVFGRGQDRTNTVFGYGWGPKNLASLQRTIDGSALANQVTAVSSIGGVAGSHSTPSIARYGLFQKQTSLPTVTGEIILEAYTAIEVLTLENPLPIYGFEPLPLRADGNVPEVMGEYDIGDFVYLGANYGRMVVFNSAKTGPQAVRVFGLTLSIDDNGNEKVASVQTTYQGTGA